MVVGRCLTPTLWIALGFRSREDISDLDAAYGLARLAHDELVAFAASKVAAAVMREATTPPTAVIIAIFSGLSFLCL